MADRNIDLALRIQALVQGTQDVQRLSAELQSLLQDRPGTDATAPLRQGAEQTLQVVGKLKGALLGIGAGLGIGALVADIQAVAKEMGDLADRSAKVNLPVEELTALQYAAKLSGVEADALDTALLKLSRSATDAANGVKASEETFARLGVNVRDSTGNLKRADALLGDLAEAFATLRDGPEKAALAMELFGRSGAALIPLLDEGRAGIAALKDEAARLGAVMDSEAVAAAERYGDNLDKLGVAFKRLKVAAAEEILPALSEITEAMVQAAQESGPFMAALVGFGGVVDKLLTKSELSQLKDRRKELEGEIGKLRQIVSTGILPEEELPLMPFDIRLNEKALAGFRNTLLKYEAEYKAIGARIDAATSPAKAAAAPDPRAERERALRDELQQTQEAYESGLKTRVEDYQRLESAIVTAMANAAKAEKTYLDQAAQLRAQATARAKDSSVEGQASATLDLVTAQQKLMRLQESGAGLDAVKAQADEVRNLAKLLDDQARAQEAVRAAALAQAQALESAAKEEATIQQGLQQQLAATRAELAGMKTDMQALSSQDNKVKLTGDFDAVKADLQNIETQLARLAAGIDIPVNLVATAPGGGSEDLESAVKRIIRDEAARYRGAGGY